MITRDPKRTKTLLHVGKTVGVLQFSKNKKANRMSVNLLFLFMVGGTGLEPVTLGL
jgi:hypothetical protein